MTLKRFVEKIEDVDEAARGFYSEVEGGKGYRLDAEPDDGGELKRTLQNVRHERDEARTARDSLKTQVDEIAAKLDGVELDDVLKAAAKAKAKAKGKGKGDDDDGGADVEALIEAAREEGREQIQAKLGKEIETKDSEISRLTRSIETNIVDRVVAEAIASQGGNHKFLSHVVRSAVKPIYEGDDIAVRVVDENGQTVISQVAGNNGPMEPSEFVALLKADKEYAGAFTGTGASGGGAPKNSDGGAGTATTKAELGSAANRAAYIHKYGEDAYLDLPDGA